MFNPGGLTLAELSATVRDLAIVTFLIGLGWKGRGIVQPVVDVFKQAKDFFVRADHHMITMETQMNSLLNNHLAHLKQAESETKPEEKQK